MKTERDDWLAKTLGRNSFKVKVTRGSSVDGIRDAAQEMCCGFYYAKLSTAAVTQLQILSQYGFFVVDVNITLERPPDHELRSSAASDGSICDFDASRHFDIARIGQDCFKYSRFHLDPNVPNEVADRVKRAWVENCMSGERGDRLLVAEEKGLPVGFLALLTVEEPTGRTAVIDLVGVDPRSQGRGIGRSLVNRALWQPGDSIDIVRVGTQAANVPSLRLYENLGFRIVKTEYILHAHV